MDSAAEMMGFPSGRPDANPVGVWSVQQDLLARAQRLLGPRDETKQIFQPVFSPGGPHLINTPACDGAFAALSMEAANYWPTLVYELAHETVHLMDPTVGPTNWLEEGVAVLFSIEMSRTLTNHPMAPGAQPASYRMAAELDPARKATCRPCPAGLYRCQAGFGAGESALKRRELAVKRRMACSSRFRDMG
jgi:hypothetical protein